MRTVLVTGVAGFIGSNLAMALLQRGYGVLGLDNLSQGNRTNMAGFSSHPAFEFHEGDIRDASLVASLVVRADCIAHLAAYKIPRYSNALDTIQINTQGTRTILDAAAECGCRVVTASTSDVYGMNPSLPFAETSDLWLGPSTVRRWAYAASKLYDEHLALAYQESRNLPVVLIRFFGGYGPNQNTTWWGGPQSVFIDAALRNQEMDIGCSL